MRVVLATLTALLALAACGEDDPGSRATTAPPDPGSVDLTQDWSCGLGFTVSDEAETTMLRVHLDPSAGTRLTRTVELPAPGWTAEVQVGSRLGANWCSDVIEDPEREVDETWQVVEGTLRFDGALPTARANAGEPTEVTGEISDVVVVSPDGERVELGDVSVRNRLWGFFAPG